MKKYWTVLLTLVLIVLCPMQAASATISLEPTTQDLEWRETVPPDNILSFTAEIDGWQRSWKVYVPSSYDGSQAVPLLVSVHGGSSHSGHYRTTWHLIAEREGFIVLYPECLVDGQTTWNVWNHYSREDGFADDVKYIDEVISRTLGSYNINRNRLYIHGQSMGDMMVSTYIYQRGDMFAAAAPLSGPTSPTAYGWFGDSGTPNYTPQHSLPVVRTRGTADLSVPSVSVPSGYSSVQLQRFKIETNNWVNNKLWRDRLNANPLPLFATTHDKNYEIYEGDYQFVNYIVDGGEHNPDTDMADYVWNYFLAPYERTNGAGSPVVRTSRGQALAPDSGAIALAAGSNQAYVNNQRVTIQGSSRSVSTQIINGTYYVPVKFLETAYPGTIVSMRNNNQTAEIDYNGTVYTVNRGHWTVLVDQNLAQISKPEYVTGELLVPFADLAYLIYGDKTLFTDGASYTVDHDAVLTVDMAYTIKVILGVQREPTYASATELCRRYAS